MHREPKPGEIYQHFKNRKYQIVTVATHSETGEKLVIYQALYGGFKVYARPYESFVALVDKEKYPDVKQKYRFERITQEEQTEEETKKEVLKNEEQKEVGKPKKRKIRSYEEIEMESETAQEIEKETVRKELLAFLEADTYKERKNILMSVRKSIDDDLINAMAAAMDVVVEEGPIDARFRSLMNCIETNMKFETNRFR